MAAEAKKLRAAAGPVWAGRQGGTGNVAVAVEGAVTTAATGAGDVTEAREGAEAGMMVQGTAIVRGTGIETETGVERGTRIIARVVAVGDQGMIGIVPSGRSVQMLGSPCFKRIKRPHLACKRLG